MNKRQIYLAFNLTLFSLISTLSSRAETSTDCELTFKQCTESVGICASDVERLNSFLNSGNNVTKTQDLCHEHCNVALKTCYVFLDACEKDVTENVLMQTKDLIAQVNNKYLKSCQWDSDQCEDRRIECQTSSTDCLTAVTNSAFSKSTAPGKKGDNSANTCKKTCAQSLNHCQSALSMCKDKLSVPVRAEIEKFIDVIKTQSSKCE